MKIRLQLRYAREPELVALRYNPCLDFSGIAKQALWAYLNKTEFHITIPEDSSYVKKPLVLYINLDEKNFNEKRIITMLHENKAPNTTFVRNILIRSISNDLSAIYKDEKLKAMALETVKE